MKRIAIVLLLVIAVGIYAKRRFYGPKIQTEIAANDIKNGDIIFQTSLSSQSKAIQLATNSPYSHCGIIYKNGSDFYVFEAVQPVKMTPLQKWIVRGKSGKFVIKRLRDTSILTPETLVKMKNVGQHFSGKDYDLTFEWSDKKMYCSELIWKIYKRGAGIEVGKPEKLSDFNLENTAVQQKMKERYGDHIPKNETVISPKAIFDSDLLETVAEN
ncbi:MAG TPA: YiiX family permuted papain-like enzyme [Flavobacterium sp.]|nr:YiiX family permuted papain-like enzyme [Flavobacterium sp.]